MSMIIPVAIGGTTSEYTLEENQGGIIVKIPYIEQDEDFNDVVDFNIVEVKSGEKAEMIRQFFNEQSDVIVREGIAFNIDDILFDTVSLPSQIQPQEIGD